jgi:hypothetical protein
MQIENTKSKMPVTAADQFTHSGIRNTPSNKTRVSFRFGKTQLIYTAAKLAPEKSCAEETIG